MIKRYTDHSANERTYLAWIRTAIAIMAFGFIIERFDLFIFYIGRAINDTKNFQPSISAEFVGLGLFLVGIFIVVSATARFFMYKKFIEVEEFIPYGVRRTNILLSALMVALGLFLFFYIGHHIF